jgi:predicted house-cleaning noncanonical NTP pyrophosphatase (MazG superfamily)
VPTVLPHQYFADLRENFVSELVRADGRDPIVHVADDQEYSAQLRAKLTEEVDKFLTSDDDSKN